MTLMKMARIFIENFLVNAIYLIL